MCALEDGLITAQLGLASSTWENICIDGIDGVLTVLNIFVQSSLHIFLVFTYSFSESHSNLLKILKNTSV